MSPPRWLLTFAAVAAPLSFACARGAQGELAADEHVASAEAGLAEAGPLEAGAPDLRDAGVDGRGVDASDAGTGDAGAGDAGVPRGGLVAEWLFAGGTTDTSGHGHDGVGVDVTLVPDRHGKPAAAAAFNGRSSYVQVPGAPELDLHGAFSVSAWIRPQSFGWLRGIVSKYRSPSARGFTLRLHFLPPYDGVDFMESGVDAGVPSTLTAGSWAHVVATANGRMVTIWVNGVVVQRGTAGYDTAANGDALGIGTDYTDRFFDGVIDDLRLYARELGSGDVAALYAE